jgi:uncharacterized protein
MSQQNVDVVRRAYDAFSRGDLDEIFRIFDDSIAFNLAENSPLYGGKPWVGRQEIMDNVFGRIAQETENFTIVPEAIHDAGDVVVVQGRYKGRNLTTGLDIDVQVCHIWTVSNGRLVRMDQYMDTWKAREVYGEPRRSASAN